VLSTLKKTLISFLLLSVAGCSTGLRIDRSHPSVNQDNRIQFVVLHYTNASLERSLALLTHGEVSSHYLIGDGPATVYQLVDENRRAWHAGDSQWQGRTWLNSSSIGIEIVNPGFTDTPNGRVWHPYSEAQVQSLIALLKDIVKRVTTSSHGTSLATAISRRCASLTRGRYFRGNAWPTPGWGSGRMQLPWHGSKPISASTRRALAGTSRSWRGLAMRSSRLGYWMLPPAM
jgi:Negative regulator of beta-lactamase expression